MLGDLSDYVLDSQVDIIRKADKGERRQRSRQDFNINAVNAKPRVG
jgi:hypothetical protein